MSSRFVAALVFAAALLTIEKAQADLQVFPLRVVLTESDRAAQISVRYKGAKPMRYRIDAVFYKMNPDGSMEQVKEPAKTEHSAIEYFRYSPRHLTLEPEVEQVVRIQIRLPAELADGDYYAHLYFEGMDENDEKAPPITTGAAAQKMLESRTAAAVPVIVRKGKFDLKVALENFQTVTLADGKLSYKVDVVKSGTSDLYGDFIATLTPAGTDKQNILSQASGVSSYIEKRSVTYPLNVVKLENGTLKLEVKEPVSDGGKLLASTSLEIKPEPTPAPLETKIAPPSPDKKPAPAGSETKPVPPAPENSSTETQPSPSPSRP